MTTTEKQSATRIYTVKKDNAERLVRASHPTRAYGHVYGAKVDDCVAVANQAKLVHLLAAGVKIEDADAPAPPKPAAGVKP